MEKKHRSLKNGIPNHYAARRGFRIESAKAGGSVTGLACRQASSAGSTVSVPNSVIVQPTSMIRPKL